ncbi:transglycosylase domain-containing protein [Marispirochaeta aestuarii]|uniref:transglycosylase domain-containing protein n=1 Tax=Marispirochaeta aestuarii TaxID=1963862 RepID=UPI002ABE66F6|nr:transglycosylase domain-containing protein [Marispirochaeta aestuarii]
MSKRSLSCLVFLPWVCILAAALLAGLSLLLPFPELRELRSGPWSLRVEDRRGGLLQVLPVNDEGLRREYLPLDALPPYLLAIFIAGEDGRFFLHPGVDPAAAVRAAVSNLRAGGVVSGASTVTMQLAGRAAPGGPGLGGKLREAWNALRVEARMSKGEILELWLNTLPMGSNVEGVASAAREYFSRNIQSLSPEESALLALIPRNPRRYDPRHGGSIEAAVNLLHRAGIVTDRKKLGAVTERSAGIGKIEPWPFRAPHFVRYVDGLPGINSKEVFVSSLDPEVQEILQGEISARVESAGENRISNGAGLALSVETGEVLAWVGSADFFDTESQGQIDGVRIRRQPGSTIKPFLYALALEKGMTPATLLPDIPSAFGSEAVYLPENFSNTCHGPVRLRVALASSLNIPAVHTVVRTGVADFTDWLLALGFDSLEDQRDSLGAGIALGNAELSLLELLTAFSVFQRDGLFLSSSVERALPGSFPRRVMSRETAFLIRDILSSESGRITGFGTGSILNTPYPAMFKTGTSNQFNNIWALGATGKVALGIWMGNFSGETVIGRPGSSIPAAAAVAVLDALQEKPAYRVSEEAYPPPEGITRVKICPVTGERAGPHCPGSLEEYFRTGTEPGPCSAHREDGIYMPSMYRSWGDERGLPWKYRMDESLRILSPADGAVFYLDSTLPRESQVLSIEAEGQGDLLISVNGTLQARGRDFVSLRFPLSPGSHRISLEGAESRIESSFSVR